MAIEEAETRYLLAREVGIWQAEAERTQHRLDDLRRGGPEAAAAEQAWYDYCFRKHEQVAWELDKIENPQKYSAANVPRESLDDLDRQTE
jgi:hypothetical protein